MMIQKFVNYKLSYPKWVSCIIDRVGDVFHLSCLIQSVMENQDTVGREQFVRFRSRPPSRPGNAQAH